MSPPQLVLGALAYFITFGEVPKRSEGGWGFELGQSNHEIRAFLLSSMYQELDILHNERFTVLALYRARSVLVLFPENLWESVALGICCRVVSHLPRTDCLSTSSIAGLLSVLLL